MNTKTIVWIAIFVFAVVAGSDILTALLGLFDSSVCSAFEQAIGACL